MRVALVTDWAYSGGSELVVEALHQLYPDAPIYTSYCSDDWRKRLDNKVVTGYLQHPPFRQLRKFLPLLRQWWFARLDLSQFDLVISVTGNGEAKFVRVPNGKHVCYCNTPVHFYWRHYEEYVQNPSFKPKWLARLGLRLLVKPLRKRDYKAAQKVDYFMANSTHIQNDIRAFYHRDSEVVFPPVDVEYFTKARAPAERKGFVTHGRLVPYKKVDLIIEACNQLALPLTVIGTGPELSRLKQLGGPTITFAGFVEQADLPDVLARHQAYVFAAYEDFGIAPVEAMAAGLPVFAYEAGGALDYVIPNKTGDFFSEQTVESIKSALQNNATYDNKEIKDHTHIFSSDAFKTKIQSSIQSNLER